VSAETEEAAIQIRDEVPPLNAFDRIKLQYLQHDYDNRHATTTLNIVDRQPLRRSEGTASIAVPGIDQCLFAFDGEDSRGSSKVYRERATISGLASTRIDIEDEIWQFERTPLAVVARPSRRGYTLVGRACLLRDISTGCHSDKADSRWSHWQLEDDLVWVKDAKLHHKLTPVIEVDVRGLLKLMTWVTYDT
jgi:hypothetical protein